MTSGFFPPGPQRCVDPLLAAMADQAAQADRTRKLDPDMVAAIKASDVMRLAASQNIGGIESSITQIGRELEAVAASCASTAWTLWNHLAVFHLFVGTSGPDHADLLAGMVERHEWVCFPAGAGSGVLGVVESSPEQSSDDGQPTAGPHVRLNGRGSFSTGGRYADWAGVVFVVCDENGERIEPLDIRFTVVAIDQEGVKIDPTWDGSGLRASATDDIHYTDVLVPLDRCVEWFGANRAETLREVPVVAERYREDWVGLSDLWLGWMAVGLARAAIEETTAGVRDRRSIMGKKMVTRPTIQVNLGQAAALISAAEAVMTTACREVDDRIEAGRIPNEADYLRQMALSSGALAHIEEAMGLMLRSLGGNGLRESGAFDRRWRDFQAMPLHINAHRDRVNHQLGRFVLGEELEPF